MLDNTITLSQIVETVIAKEESNLIELDVKARILQAISDPSRLRKFAEAFYFVRYDFPRINFIVGERCGVNELLWRGIAGNLIEELGGKNGPSHNQLYRDFLSCVGIDNERSLQEPLFANKFNTHWESFCRNASLEEALSAIAIYEIFDQPDYQLLLDVLQEANVDQRGLRFFYVHAVAKHFEMFEDTVKWLMDQENGQAAFESAMKFVFTTQREMWKGLLEDLSDCEPSNSTD
jgi:pyrroloquinoline quinone (PQQ) biosynthesis protein C